MVGGQFGEIDTSKMKSNDPSDFLECLNWNEAFTKSVGYENDDIISYYSNQFGHDKPWLQRRTHSTLEDLALSERQANLFFGFALAVVKLKKQNIRVLDIGGGNGYMAYWLRDFFPELSFEWIILESKSVAESYNTWKDAAQISWIHKDAFNATYDIILVSCALQYIENWSRLLVDSVNKCQILLLMRLSILENDQHKFGVHKIFRKSINGEFDASVPCHFFAANEIYNQISTKMTPIYQLIYDHESVIFDDEEVKFQDLFFQK